MASIRELYAARGVRATLRCFYDQPGVMRGHCHRFCDLGDPAGSGCPYSCAYSEGTGNVGVCLP